MAGEREKVNRADAAEAVKALAGIPWKEMLDVQRKTADVLRSIRENLERSAPAAPEGEGESGTPDGTRVAIAISSSTASVVSALEDVSAMEVSTRSAVFECSGRLARCASTLDSILSGIDGVRRGLRSWGLVLALLLLLNAASEIRWLAALWSGWFG